MNDTDSAALYQDIRLNARRRTLSLLSSIVSEQQVEAFCQKAGLEYRDRIFPPHVTLCGMLLQAFNDNKSQSKTVIKLMEQLHEAGRPTGSHDPHSFCTARQRLPEGLIPWLSQQTAHLLEKRVCSRPDSWNRPVKLVDGTTVSMPDTPENAAYFGYPGGQAEGCGFPQARICAVFSLATGALLDVEIDPIRTSENEQWTRIQEKLNSGDIGVGDRLFGSYAAIVRLRQRGADGIFRLHQTRKAPPGDWTDRIVTWKKKKRPAGMSIKDYRALPNTIRIRLIRANQVDPDTKRKTEIIIATTLLNADLYPADMIVKLYGRRWEVEIDLRHVKSAMKMKVLSGKLPHTVTLEIRAHLLAYNVLRILMWQAGTKHRVDPLRLSLERTRHEMLAYYKACAPRRPKRFQKLLDDVASHRIPDRPGRVEPRVVKRRHSKFPYMTQPRDVLRRELCQTA